MSGVPIKPSCLGNTDAQGVLNELYPCSRGNKSAWFTALLSMFSLCNSSLNGYLKEEALIQYWIKEGDKDKALKPMSESLALLGDRTSEITTLMGDVGSGG